MLYLTEKNAIFKRSWSKLLCNLKQMSRAKPNQIIFGRDQIGLDDIYAYLFSYMNLSRYASN